MSVPLPDRVGLNLKAVTFISVSVRVAHGKLEIFHFPVEKNTHINILACTKVPFLKFRRKDVICASFTGITLPNRFLIHADFRPEFLFFLPADQCV
jgi:hypothetical protein